MKLTNLDKPDLKSGDANTHGVDSSAVGEDLTATKTAAEEKGASIKEGDSDAFGGHANEAEAKRSLSAPKSGWAAHLKQELLELAVELDGEYLTNAVLAPSPDSASGYRVLEMKSRHESGMMVSGKVSQFPSASLLGALGLRDRQTVLLPELKSSALDKNLRAGIWVPPQFDPEKPINVVALSPTPATSVAGLTRGGPHSRRMAEFLADLPANSLVVMPETRQSLSKNATAEFLKTDILPLLRKSVDVEVKAAGVFSAQSFKAIGKSKPSSESKPTKKAHSFYSEPARTKEAPSGGGGGWFSFLNPFKKTLGEEVAETRNPIIKAGYKDVAVYSGREATLAGLSNERGPVNDDVIKVARENKSPTVFLSSIDTGSKDASPYVAILPPNYNPNRNYPLTVTTVAGRLDSNLDSVHELAKSDGIVVVHQGKRGDGATSSGSVGAYELVSSLPIDFSQLQLNHVDKSGKVSTKVTTDNPAKMYGRNGWYTLPPDPNYKTAIPSTRGVYSTQGIPKSIQKQSADRGSLFVAPVKSRALGDNMTQVGVYLPPGYDPAQAKEYPVLMMLPGKGGDLATFTVGGGSTEVLDEAMKDGEKFIVVIPGSTDSFYYDYDANGDSKQGTRGERDFEGYVLDEVLGYVNSELNADLDRVSLLGISRGGFGALSLAARHPGRFASVSAHSAVVPPEVELGVLGGTAESSSSVRAHFAKDGSHDIWGKVNPANLAAQGAFKKQPNIYIDIAASDPYFADENFEFTDQLKNLGVEHDFVAYEGTDGGFNKPHSWEAWSAMMPQWVRFHQSTAPGGAASASKLGSPVDDVTKEVMADHRAEYKAQVKANVEAFADVGKLAKSLEKRNKKVAAAISSSWGGKLSELNDAASEPLDKLKEQLGAHSKGEGLAGRPAHVQEAVVAYLERIAKDADEQITFLEQTNELIESHEAKELDGLGKELDKRPDLLSWRRNPISDMGHTLDSVPFVPSAVLRDARSDHRSLVKALDKFDGSDSDVRRLSREVDSAMSSLKKARRVMKDLDRVSGPDFGSVPVVPKPDPAALGRLSKASRSALESVMKAVPETREALLLLATARPEVLEGKDRLTNENFSQQLADFVRTGAFENDDAPGLAKFIERVAIRRFDWRRGGYSHTVCSAMNIVYNHPGMVLTFTQAARDGDSLDFSKNFEPYGSFGDSKLSPTTDFKRAFESRRKDRDLPAAELGYERGLLRVIRDELAPPKWVDRPEHHFAGLCSPPAMAMAKVCGEDVRYGYAFSIETGRDLVKALATQNGEGLAFADIKMSYDGRSMPRGSHFPVFYGYDEKTDTVRFQDWNRSERVLDVDKIELGSVGGYYRNPEVYEREFLTPQHQPNWKKVKHLYPWIKESA